VIDSKNWLLAEMHEISKHQKPNPKQIPMIQIPNKNPSALVTNGVIDVGPKFAKRGKAFGCKWIRF
jgi:hypothetical protein